MTSPLYRVSSLAAFARWKATEGDGIGWLYNSIFKNEDTEAMSRGTAFHKAIEMVPEGEYLTVEAMGYTFAFTCNAELYLPKKREHRRSKDYGGIIITGQCDGIKGRHIIDHKTTSKQFDAEHYMDGWQWRYYLDIFEADRFDWHIWQVAELKEPKAFEVSGHHFLTQYRYVGLEEDCRELALEFLEFSNRMGWSELKIPAI